MRAWLISFFTLWLIIVPSAIQAQRGRARIAKREKAILNELLDPENYDRRIRPSSVNDTDHTTKVHANMLIRNIEVLDDVKMELKLQVTIRQQWNDDRLEFDSLGGQIKYITVSEDNVLWMPDLFIKQERTGHSHDLAAPNLYFRIYSDGTVMHSRRLSLTLFCPMDLQLYPMDYQTCKMQIASYAHTADDITFIWEENNPVQVTKNLNTPHFSLTKFTTDYCNARTNTGTYSCLSLEMSFQRDFSFYMLTIYIPCVMFVLVSWLALWLDRQATAARIAMTTITLAVMSGGAAFISFSLVAPTGYTKAIDVWTGMCLTFVFGALCECVLVNFLTPSSPDGSPKLRNLSRLIDVVSRIAYPAAFLLFNIIYWLTYLNVDHHDRECGEHLDSCTVTGM